MANNSVIFSVRTIVLLYFVNNKWWRPRQWVYCRCIKKKDLLQQFINVYGLLSCFSEGYLVFIIVYSSISISDFKRGFLLLLLIWVHPYQGLIWTVVIVFNDMNRLISRLWLLKWVLPLEGCSLNYCEVLVYNKNRS